MSSVFDRDRSAERLPVSLITGFLGSGKTTLLNRLVQRQEMADSAVIINEFGEIALDHLLIAPVAGEAVVLASGCLCCAVRGDLQDTLRDLLVKRDRGEVPAFARILIETSGLADPAPVAQLLLNNPLLGHYVRLDAVIATVAAAGPGSLLAGHWEARKQIAIADRLLLTKIDIATDAEAARAVRELRVLNATAEIMTVVHGDIPPDRLFGVAAFEHLGGGYAAAEPHAHSHEIAGHCLTAEKPIDWAAFHDWLGRLRAEHGEKLLRVKGVLNVAGESGPVVIQGVQHVFHPPVALPAWPDRDRRSRLVMISRALDRALLETSWRALGGFSPGGGGLAR